MEISLLMQLPIAAIAAILLYTFIGFIPGTDETSVLVPVTLALVLAGVSPIVVLTFFIAAIVTLNLTNAIPTALVGLPGGVLSTPMMEHSIYLKEKGRAAETIKKMAAGSGIGTLVSIPVSLAIATAITPYAETLREYGSLLFVFGAVVLALLGANRLLSLLAIIPMSLLFQGLLSLYRDQGVIPEDGNISVSFFLGITIGPMLVSILGLLNRNTRKELPRHKPMKFNISRNEMRGQSLSPKNILTKGETVRTALLSLVTPLFFFLRPVGLTFLLGKVAEGRSSSRVERANNSITAMK